MLINESIPIAQDPESVWDFWLDVANDVHWRDGITKAEWTSPPPFGIGSTGEHIHKDIGTLNWEITKFEDGHSFEFIHTAGGLKGSVALFQVEPANGGSLVSIQVNLTGPFLMRIMMLFMGYMMRKGVAGDLQKLKNILETKKMNA